MKENLTTEKNSIELLDNEHHFYINKRDAFLEVNSSRIEYVKKNGKLRIRFTIEAVVRDEYRGDGVYVLFNILSTKSVFDIKEWYTLMSDIISSDCESGISSTNYRGSPLCSLDYRISIGKDKINCWNLIAYTASSWELDKYFKKSTTKEKSHKDYIL